MSSKDKIKVAVLAITACLLWSSAFAAVKYCLDFWSPLTLIGGRFILAGLLLVPLWISKVKNPLHAIRSNARTILTVCLLQSIMQYGFFSYGMKLVPGALGAIIIGASPLVMAVVAHIATHNDRLSWRKLFSLALGFSGIVTIALSCKPWTSQGIVQVIGIGLLLATTTSAAVGNLVVQKVACNPFMMNSIQLFLGGLVLFVIGVNLPVSLGGGMPDVHLTAKFYAAFAWMAVISAFAFSIWFHLLQLPYTKASELALWKFIIPVAGAGLSWVLLPNENPSIPAVVGMICVAVSIVFYQKKQQTALSVHSDQSGCAANDR